MKSSGIGGQAVIEGVMMKNKSEYAIAVRKTNNEIVVEKSTFNSVAEKYKIFKLPIFRGMLSFVESMIIGSRTLTVSAGFFEEEEEVKPSKMEKAFSKVFKEKAESVVMGITMLVSVILAIGIFILLPTFMADLLTEVVQSKVLLTIIEGCIRIFLFVSYVAAISQIKDIKRMFMYHGAEHKTINCIEHGYELTVENVKRQSREHKRCGTSFMFIVMFVSIIFFIFIRVEQQWLRYTVRVLLIPAIAGVSYEFIRLSGRSESRIVNILSRPGMWLQALTTKEPDNDMIEVAIQSVEAVFDWREFLSTNKTKDSKNKSDKNSGQHGKTNKNRKVSQNSKVNKDSKINQDNKVNQNSNIGQGSKLNQSAKLDQNSNIDQGGKLNQNAKLNQNSKINQNNKKNRNSNIKSNDKIEEVSDEVIAKKESLKLKSKIKAESTINHLEEDKFGDNPNKDIPNKDNSKDNQHRNEKHKKSDYKHTNSSEVLNNTDRKHGTDEEIAATAVKMKEFKDNPYIDEEEDDEILMALDRYLYINENSKEEE